LSDPSGSKITKADEIAMGSGYPHISNAPIVFALNMESKNINPRMGDSISGIYLGREQLGPDTNSKNGDTHIAQCDEFSLNIN
jgi:hypothetical protein